MIGSMGEVGGRFSVVAEILVEDNAVQRKEVKPVYIEGPRVHEETKTGCVAGSMLSRRARHEYRTV
jgi:hypothetical protein